MMSTIETPQLNSQEIIGWKIWYSDSTFDSTQGSWADAPDDDVQVVMIYFQIKDGQNRPTRLYSSGCDVYALDSDGKFTSHFNDPKMVFGVVKHGKFMNYEKLMEVEKQAFNDYGEGWLWSPEAETTTIVPEKMEL